MLKEYIITRKKQLEAESDIIKNNITKNLLQAAKLRYACERLVRIDYLLDELNLCLNYCITSNRAQK